MNLAPFDFDHDAVCNASVFWITGTGLSEEPSRSTRLEMLEQREQGARPRGADSVLGAGAPLTVLDLDCRAAATSGRARRSADISSQRVFGRRRDVKPVSDREPSGE